MISEDTAANIERSIHRLQSCVRNASEEVGTIQNLTNDLGLRDIAELAEQYHHLFDNDSDIANLTRRIMISLKEEIEQKDETN